MDTDKNNHRTTLVKKIIPKTKFSIIFACLAAIFGVSITLITEQWIETGVDYFVTVQSIVVRSTPGFKDQYWLDVILDVPNATRCSRDSQHFLRTHDKPPIFLPLGSGITGAGFFSLKENDQAIISFELPPGMPAGEWFYTYRTIYTCIFWPGLVKHIGHETSPILITIPPN